MKTDELKEVIVTQKAALDARDSGLPRELLAALPDKKNIALDITGIRRCGKSTLLLQFVRQLGRPFFYFNFDEVRLGRFEVSDYRILDRFIKESGTRMLFLDEVQLAPLWERYVRQKLDENYQVLVTGSNASLLSAEFGAHLTGRHLSFDLYPFSYNEYCAFTKKKPGLASLEAYLSDGGFPEFLKLKDDRYLNDLQQDVLYRDIINRYGIRDGKSLRELYLYLLSNPAQLISSSRLTTVTGVKTAATILEYLSFFENAWLMARLQRFATKQRVSSQAPKKIYIIDPGIIRTGTAAFGGNKGPLLENLVFNELRARAKNTLGEKDLYYYKDDKGHECDFVVNTRLRSPFCIQVCLEVNLDDEEREVGGLLSAMDYFKQKHGLILTLNQEDTDYEGDKTIDIVPAWKWLSLIKKGGEK
jgi:predicted AAA+ superfamily ATPase